MTYKYLWHPQDSYLSNVRYAADPIDHNLRVYLYAGALPPGDAPAPYSEENSNVIESRLDNPDGEMHSLIPITISK